MRKVTEQVVRAFLARRKLSVGNTHTDGDGLFLHGNPIAWHQAPGIIALSDAGWRSNTTKERLNGVLALLGLPPRVGIFQSDFEWFISLPTIDGPFSAFKWPGTVFVAGGNVHFTLQAATDALALAV